jgi:hypothetical protein
MTKKTIFHWALLKKEGSDMKTKIFYDHLLLIEEIEITLATHQITREECEEILHIVDKAMHSEILHKILHHLPHPYHEKFLVHFHATPHDKSLMTFLKEHTIVDIEKEILSAANAVKKKIIKEIEAAKT